MNAVAQSAGSGVEYTDFISAEEQDFLQQVSWIWY